MSPTDVLVSGSDLACRTYDPDLWFSDDSADLNVARTLCRECPLLKPCLDGAIDRAEPWGVWGGEIFERGAISPSVVPQPPITRSDVDASGREPRKVPRDHLAASAFLKHASVLLPVSMRTRWVEEWDGELAVLATRRLRFRFLYQTLVGIPNLAIALRRPAARSAK